MMNLLLNLLVIIPAAGFAASVLIPAKKENIIAGIAYTTLGVHLFIFLIFGSLWIIKGFPIVDLREFVVLRTSGYEFFIDFSFDKISATYVFVGSVLTFLVTIYSKVYLHRESGFKRFFTNTLFFYFGYNIVVFAGNFETLFIGWEILGVSSFLLIAFYRDRYLPVRNAVKVFSIYRIGDVGLILAMWMSHHLWNENITFLKLVNYDLVHSQLQSHTLLGVFISMMILLSASAKSAQLPFSSWLPRAMEGPTPSTAIFYGSLSVNIGVFLLLRTYHFWEQQTSVRIVIGLLGLTTSIICSGIARVQSSVKSQIAYASISQIGLIFIEISLGWVNLALIHFAGNAFLRTYQLLVSPSVVSYLIREQFYNFVPREHTIEDSLPKKIEYSFYVLCVKEWNLDSLLYRILWNPLKWAGTRVDFLTQKNSMLISGSIFLLGFGALTFEDAIPSLVHSVLPGLLAAIGLLFVLKAFTERHNVKLSWILVLMNHFYIALAVSFNEHFQYDETMIYLSGVMIFGIGGYVCLYLLETLEKDIDLDRFHGHSYMYPGLAFAFLVCCLCVAGFPITPTFIGEDLIFTHIHSHQLLLASFVAMGYIITGLTIIRLYARVFLGPHVNSVYEMAYRSS
jgi:NADH-quinone oxidoreductase subunit L